MRAGYVPPSDGRFLDFPAHTSMDLVDNPTTQSEARRSCGNMYGCGKRDEHQLSISISLVGRTVSEPITCESDTC